METNKIIIFTDGGARGNPGPAAVGIIISGNGFDPFDKLRASKPTIRKYREYIGETTNNIAEYKAAIFALKKINQIFGKDKSRSLILEINVDSELLYKQVLGEYKVKDVDLQPLFIEIWNLKQDFKEVRFNLVPREKNKEADALVNDELDSHLL